MPLPFSSTTMSRHFRHHNSTELSGSLTPLPHSLSVGLIPVSLFGILSFVFSTILFLLLSHRIFRWNRKSRHVNQFVVLIWNLLLADIQQSLAFLLNTHWLVHNGIEVGSSTCFAQGWFVSTGDLASGMWSFAIGMHTFATIIFGYRLSNTKFVLTILLIWTFVYTTAVVGVAMHPDLYVRAVAWCWVNAKYDKVRLWLHYFWIFSFEFGTVIVYGVLILSLRWRIQSNFYQGEQKMHHAKEAGKLMIAYPTIYVICTLPLATLRMYSIRNPNARVHMEWFCFAGAMITSNGWMDVLLYTLTRRIMLFSDSPPTSDNGLESFATPWSKRDPFGTETTCEHVPASRFSSRKTRRRDSDAISMVDEPYRLEPTNDLLGFVTISTERTVEVTSSPMTEAEKKAVHAGLRASKQIWSTSSAASSKSDDEGSSHPMTPMSEDYDLELQSLEFKTKPAGF